MDAEATGVSLVNAAEDKSATCAVLACKMQKTIGRPSNKTLLKTVVNNLLKNCPVTSSDIETADAIFGPDTGSLKGKPCKVLPRVSRPLSRMSQPPLRHAAAEMVLGGDIAFINPIPFFMTVS